MAIQIVQSRRFFAGVTLLLALAACSEPTGAAGRRIAVHRLFSQTFGDHMYGSNPGEGSQQGYVLEGRNYFYLAAAPAADHVPLYRCYTPQTRDHFLSTAATCEGATNQGVLGHIAASPVSGTVPLYRLFRGGTGNTFYTLDAGEANSAVVQYSYAHQGVTGYVYLTP